MYFCSEQTSGDWGAQSNGTEIRNEVSQPSRQKKSSGGFFYLNVGAPMTRAYWGGQNVEVVMGSPNLAVRRFKSSDVSLIAEPLKDLAAFSKRRIRFSHPQVLFLTRTTKSRQGNRRLRTFPKTLLWVRPPF
jgi:hypothetical protein